MANAAELSLQNLRLIDKAGSEQNDGPSLGSPARKNAAANHSPAAGSRLTPGIAVKPEDPRVSAAKSHLSGGQLEEETNVYEPADERNQVKSAAAATEFNSREDIATKIAEAAFSYDEDFHAAERHTDLLEHKDRYAAQSRYISSDAYALQFSEVTLPAKYINANNI